MAREPFNPNLIRPPRAEVKTSADQPITVSQLTAFVRDAIEAALPPTVHVVGEISNFKRHSSGHVYFTMKDRASELTCVMWRSSAANLKFTPTDGLEVIATGQVSVFERSGRYQLIARKLEPRGTGALELAFRQLHERLAKEGLFEKARKKPLPRFPQRIVVVTSPTGAALRDILHTIERRFRSLHVLIYPVRVQGAGAAAEIAAAIRRANAHHERLGGVDLMIVGRGGGSLEDLWAFNEEVVARAIFASAIPIISAVGHEVDVTIADLVADVRAVTPTAAAELAVPVLSEIVAAVESLGARFQRHLMHRTDLARAKLTGVLSRTAFREPVNALRRREQVIDEMIGRAARSLQQRLHTQRRALDRVESLLQRIAPHAYLLKTTMRLRDAEQKLRLAVERRMKGLDRALMNREARLARVSPAVSVDRWQNRVTQICDALPVAMSHRLKMLHSALDGREAVLGALSYQSVLSRGFSLTRDKKTGRLLRSVHEARDRQRIVTQLGDGQVESDVVNLHQRELFDES